jgi:hypothetical protein
LLYLGGETVAAPRVFVHPAPQPGTSFGRGVAPLGDVNGDGLSDFVIGAHLRDILDESGQVTSFNTGEAFVYFGDASSTFLPPVILRHPIQQGGAIVGFSLGAMGDINGDGFSDVFVSASGQNVSDELAAGEALVYFGSEVGLTGSPLGSSIMQPGILRHDRTDLSDRLVGPGHQRQRAPR